MNSILLAWGLWIFINRKYKGYLPAYSESIIQDPCTAFYDICYIWNASPSGVELESFHRRTLCCNTYITLVKEDIDLTSLRCLFTNRYKAESLNCVVVNGVMSNTLQDSIMKWDVIATNRQIEVKTRVKTVYAIENCRIPQSVPKIDR